MKDKNDMGNFICQMRKSKGLTQKQLAELLFVTDKAVSKWERGLSYPDISLLPLLAEALNTSTSELLAGKKEDPTDVEKTEIVVKKTLQYAGDVTKNRYKKLSYMSKLITTASLAMAAIICMICDFAINREITWSMIPVISIALVWLITMPALYFSGKRFPMALLSLSLFILPYLYLLEQSLSGGVWFGAIAVPITGLVLVLAWILWSVSFVFKKKKVSPWFVAALASLFVAMIDFWVDYVLNQASVSAAEDNSSVLTVGVVAVLVIVFIMLGAHAQKKK